MQHASELNVIDEGAAGCGKTRKAAYNYLSGEEDR